MITTTDLTGALGRNLDIIKSQTKGLTHADRTLKAFPVQLTSVRDYVRSVLTAS